MYEAAWYWVKAKELVETQEPPPIGHPQYDRIITIQHESRAKKLANAKDHIYKMWGPQIEFILQGESYEVLGLVERLKLG